MRLRIRFWLFCLVLLSSGYAGAQQKPSGTTITILQLNDVYQISAVDRGKRGGMARVGAIQKKIRAASPNTIFMLAGDFISPSVASRLFKGKQMVAALNAAGLDIATFGNHEFDFGPDVLRERMKESRFAYTIANVFERNGKPFGGASRFVIREIGGARVAVFGLLLAETASMSAPGPGVRFDDPVIAGKRVARELRRQGVDVIIALTHLPMRDDKRLAAEADIDLIVGGHEHELLESFAGHAPIIKMGSDARNLGKIDLNLAIALRSRSRNGVHRARRSSLYRVQSVDIQAIPITDALPDDPAVASVVGEYETKLNSSLGEVIGRTSVVLDARASVIRREESNLGNFLADVYRRSVEADCALINSGGIRSDSTYGPGDITKKDVLSILPFENTLVKVRLTGAHLKRLLEHGVSVAGQEDGRFPQVSGLSFSYDPARPVGSRVTGIEVGGKAIDFSNKYTLAINAYLLGGGDGYDLKGGEVVITPETGPSEPDIVMEAIRRLGTIAPQIEGRIKVTQAQKTTLLRFSLPLMEFRRVVIAGGL